MKPEFLLENQLCFRLYTASRLLTQAYHPLLSEHGLTYPQYLVLLVLWEKDAQPVNDIAKRLYLETNTVTPLIQRMEKGGILTRTKGTKDARQMIVKLTKKGKGLQDKLAEMTGLDRKIVDKAFDALKKEGAIVSPVRCKWEPAK